MQTAPPKKNKQKKTPKQTLNVIAFQQMKL